MSMDDLALKAAFAAHTEGQTKFTRRMVIAIADMGGHTPREVVVRLERLGLLKRGSWEWFIENGGFTKEHFDEARSVRGTVQNSSPSAIASPETVDGSGG